LEKSSLLVGTAAILMTILEQRTLLSSLAAICETQPLMITKLSKKTTNLKFLPTQNRSKLQLVYI
jgi:hypothetical protein